jgi:hypothetical protein
MEITVVGMPVGETVDQPGIAAEVENDRPVEGRETIKVPVRKTVGWSCGTG